MRASGTTRRSWSTVVTAALGAVVATVTLVVGPVDRPAPAPVGHRSGTDQATCGFCWIGYPYRAR